MDDASKWNSRWPIGTPVIVTLANGKRLRTVTKSEATRVGQFAMIEVEAIQPGTILLSWCWPVRGAGVKSTGMDKPKDSKPCQNCGAPMSEREPSAFCPMCQDSDGAAEERGEGAEAQDWPEM